MTIAYMCTSLYIYIKQTQMEVFSDMTPQLLLEDVWHRILSHLNVADLWSLRPVSADLCEWADKLAKPLVTERPLDSVQHFQYALALGVKFVTSNTVMGMFSRRGYILDKERLYILLVLIAISPDHPCVYAPLPPPEERLLEAGIHVARGYLGWLMFQLRLLCDPHTAERFAAFAAFPPLLKAAAAKIEGAGPALAARFEKNICSVLGLQSELIVFKLFEKAFGKQVQCNLTVDLINGDENAIAHVLNTTEDDKGMFAAACLGGIDFAFIQSKPAYSPFWYPIDIFAEHK